MPRTPSYMIDQQKKNTLQSRILSGGPVCSRKVRVVGTSSSTGIGDMLKSVYDINGNGIVDNAELVNGLAVLTAVPSGALFTDTPYNDNDVLKDSDTLSPVTNTNKLLTQEDYVNSDEGDMKKLIYDINDNGIVDNSELVNNLTVLTAVPLNAKFTDTMYDETRLNNHIDNENNPHNTTYDNIGGDQPEPITHTHIENDITNLDKYTKNEVDAKVGVVQIDIDNHIADVANPHVVSYDQLGGSQPAPIAHTHVEADITDLTHYTDTDADARVQAAIQDDTISLTSLYSSSMIESLVEGSLVYVGMWDASTNTPTLSDGTGIDGSFYSVSVAGTQDLGSGDIDFIIGDRVVYNGTIWQQSSATDTANWGEIYGDILNQADLQTALDLKTDDTNFNAHLADVANPHVVTTTQLGLENVDNTTDLNKPVSTATQTALDLKADDSDLTSHTGDVANPHGVTKAQVGLPNVPDTIAQDLVDHEADVSNPHAVTQAQVGLGNNDNTADIDKPISTLQQAEIDMKVEWKDKWVNATYYENDMVLDSPYTMIANKETTDKAGIEYIGIPYFLYSGTLTDHEITAKQVIFGNRYTASTLIQLTGFRISVVTGMEYSIFIITDPSTEPIVKQIGNKFTADNTGWINIDSTGTLVGGGLVFDLVAYVHEPAVSPSVTTLDYDYTTPNNAAEPAMGEALQANRDLGNLKFHNRDDAGDSNDAFLNGLTSGDIISTGAMVWTVQSVIDEGLTVTYGVSPATQYGTEGVTAFDFETVAATPITAGREVDANLATTTSGLYIADGAYADIVSDDNQYGIDVYVQEVSKSDDWDLVAMSGNVSGGSDDGGTTIEIVDDLLTQDSSKALSANMGYVLDNAKVANGRVLTDVPAGAVFTDTIYNDTTIQGEVDLNTAKVTDLVHPLVETAVPGGALFTDTVYTHPITPGNIHMPSGGSVGQVITNTADGDGTWQDASGGGATGDMSIARFTNASSQSIDSTSDVVIQWDTESYKDSVFTHDNVTNNSRISVSETGVYLVSGSINMYDGTANNYRLTIQVSIRVNGTTIQPELFTGGYVRQASSFRSNVTFASTLNLNAGDYVEILSRRTSDNTSAGVTGAGTNISIVHLTGAQGPQGIQGDIGDTGPQGDIGDTGADSIVPGPQGDAGTDGVDGADGLTISVVGGTNIIVDSSDAANPIVATGTDMVLTGSFTEEVYVNSGTTLEPDNGTIQTQSLSGNITFTDGLSSGQSMTLVLTNGSSYTVSYPTITWNGGVAPTLTDKDTIVFHKINSTLYGTYIGTSI